MSDLLDLYYKFVDQVDPEFLPNAHICLWRHLQTTTQEGELINHSEMSHYVKDRYLFLIIFFEIYTKYHGES